MSVAFGDDMFTVSPTWTRIDTGQTGLHVAVVEIDRGRQDEFDRTDTGTMTVTVHDESGGLDPTFRGLGECVSVPVAFAVRNPVVDEWFPRYRGVIDEVEYDLDGSQRTGTVTLHCVDAMDYFAGFELAPGVTGTFTVNDAGYVYYEDTAGNIDDRILQGLTDAGYPSGLVSVFSMNVSGQLTKYSAGESMLTVFHDAADAEFPTVANNFVDKFGIWVAHGRYARFDPDTVSASASHWDFHRWKAGDGDAIDGDADYAQARPPFVVQRSRKWIRNAALCYPQPRSDIFDRANIADQISTDPVSIGTHGVRSWSAENLVILEGTSTGNTGAEECQLYSQYITDNFSDLRNRIGSVVVKTVRPDDDRAGATHALLAQADISDVVTVTIGHPGGGGIDEDFYIEGVKERIEPLVKDLDTGYPMHTMELNLSPAAYWGTSPFPALS